jgi:hypothetical protein
MVNGTPLSPPGCWTGWFRRSHHIRFLWSRRPKARIVSIGLTAATGQRRRGPCRRQPGPRDVEEDTLIRLDPDTIYGFNVGMLFSGTPAVRTPRCIGEDGTPPGHAVIRPSRDTRQHAHPSSTMFSLTCPPARSDTRRQWKGSHMSASGVRPRTRDASAPRRRCSDDTHTLH